MKEYFKNFQIVSGILLLGILLFGFKYAQADPSNPAGVGSGAISADSLGNIGIGTTATGGVKLKVTASSSDSSTHALQLLQQSGNPILYARGDARVGIATTTLNYALNVNGQVFASGGFVGNIGASNVTSGVFGSGNFAFPASLGVATSSQVGLPEVLSVFGNAYFESASGTNIRLNGTAANANSEFSFLEGNAQGVRIRYDGTANQLNLLNYADSAPMVTFQRTGNVGIGTTTPVAKLEVVSANEIARFGGGTVPYVTVGNGLTATTGGYVQWDDTNNIMYVSPHGLQALSINSSGNVAVGTSTFSAKLNIGGTAGVDGIRFPDGTLQTTAGGGTTISAANVSSGSFGANTGGGNYSFPAHIGLSSGNSLYLNGIADANWTIGKDNNHNVNFRGSGTGSRSFQFIDNSSGSDVVRAMINISTGNVGIGTTTPSGLLQVNLPAFTSRDTDSQQVIFGNNTDSNYGIRFGFDGSGGRGYINVLNPSVAWGNLILQDGGGNVGIGTTTPGVATYAAPLTVDSSNQLGTFIKISNTENTYKMGGIWLRENTANAGWLFGTDNNGKAVMHYGTGASETASISAAKDGTTGITIDTSGNLGIGTTTPAALLSVGSSTTGLVATFGGGTGKINVGTIDPLYTIGGKRYATYLPSMTGQKEETTGNLVLEPNEYGEYSKVINFEKAEEGSDIWLFGKVTNILDNEKNWEELAVMLTPSFPGDVWFEKNNKSKEITIFAEPNESWISRNENSSLSISFRLTAPRFDSAKWTNISTDQEEGFNLDKLLQAQW